MFLQEEIQQPLENGCPQISIKPVMIPTYATQSLAPSSFNMSHDSSFQKSMESSKASADVSLEEQIFKGNAELLRTAVVQYLKMCLGQKFYEIRGNLLKNMVGSNQSMGCDEEESIMELILSNNRLLSHQTQIKFFDYIQQYQEISWLFKQLRVLLGNTLTQEFAFILTKILALKFQAFKKLTSCETFDIIPQMERFWGDQGSQRFLPNGWQIFQDIDYTIIKKFSVQKVEEMASKIYYAPELEYLNLSQVQIGNAEASDKFSALVCLFSETLFLTMSGIRQEKEDLEEFLQELKIQITFGEANNEQPYKRTKLL